MNRDDIVQVAPHNLPEHGPRPAGRESLERILQESGLITPEGRQRIDALMKEEPLIGFADAALRLGLIGEHDLERLLGEPSVYGYLPPSSEILSPEIAVAHEPYGHFAETIQGIAGQLTLRWFDGNPSRKALAVVSLGRREGRTHIAANLALALAQFGRRTLLVDADLRRPRLHHLFNIDHAPGLSGLLADNGRENGHPPGRRAIVPLRAYPELDVLPAGLVLDNPLNLLNRQRFAELVAQASTEYDAVIFDTPAACSGVDAKIIATRAGGTMVIARSDQTLRGPFAEMVKILRRAGCTLLGSVLNDPPASANRA